MKLGLGSDGEPNWRAAVLCYVCFADSELKILFKH